MSRDSLRNYEYRPVVRQAKKSKTDRRRELDFAIEELDFRREMLEDMAPATDNYAHMMWRVRALQRAIAELRKPHFEVSPFL